VKRNAELGPIEVEKRRLAAWSASEHLFPKWITSLTYARGPAAVKQAYLRTLDGKVDGSEGVVGSLWAEGESAKL
jgi:hypothetical protein